MNLVTGFGRPFWRSELGQDAADGQQQSAGRLVGGILVILIAAWSFNLGASQYRDNVDSAWFYQRLFEPALSLACDGQFRVVVPTKEAVSFLTGKTERLSTCDGLAQQPQRIAESFHRTNAYLQLVAALCWSMLGIAWINLYPLAGALAALYGVSAYLLLRAFTASRLLAAGLAFVVVNAAPAVAQIPHIRDYAKAPFITAALAALALGVLRADSIKKQLALFFLAGATISIGVGFRSDVQMLWPIALLAALMLARKGRPPRANLCVCAAAVAALIVGFVVLRIPYWLLFLGAGQAPINTGHVFVLGLAETFFLNLGMDRAAYGLIAFYKDEYASGLIRLFYGIKDKLPVYGPAYQESAMALLRQIAGLVPYDILMRAVFSLINTATLPLMNLVIGLQLLLILPLTFVYNWRATILLIASMVICIGVLSLQYHPRHVFFLSIFAACLLALTATALVALVGGIARQDWQGSSVGRRALTFGIVVVGVMAAVTASTGVARNIQERGLHEAADRYAGLSWRRADITTAAGVVRLGNPSDIAPGAIGRLTIRRDAEPGDLPELDLPPKWNTRDGNTVEVDENGFRAVSNVRGYAAWTPGVAAGELGPAPETGGDDLQIYISFDYVVESGVFDFFILSDKATFHLRQRLGGEDKGRFGQTISVPADAKNLRFVFSNAANRPGTIRVTGFAARDGSGSCLPRATRISPKFAFSNESPSVVPLRVAPGSSELAYYFPIMLTEAAKLVEVAAKDIPAQCIDLSVADAVKGSPPLELLLQGGVVAETVRSTWTDAWRRFRFLASRAYLSTPPRGSP